jgi:hypothetical protein
MPSNWKPGFKYFFTLTPDVETVPVGEVPTGYRIDLRYTNGKATTDAADFDANWLGGRVPPALAAAMKPARVKALDAILGGKYENDIRKRRDPSSGALTYAQIKSNEEDLIELRQARLLEWFGIEGSVLSGSDWVTIRKDGVAVFDGRVTIKTTDGTLIDAVVGGAVDLRDRSKQELQAPTADPRSPAYDGWLRGALVQPVSTVLSVRFEAASATKSWAANTIRAASEGFWKYERLVRGQFVAVGTVDTQKASYSPVSAVSLDIYEVVLEPRSGAGLAGWSPARHSTDPSEREEG